MDALNRPNANVTPGVIGQVGRDIDSALGTNLFGNLTDTQVADALNKQEILGQFKTAAQGQGGRGSNALRSFIMEAQPHMGQDPAAMKQIIGVLQDNNNLNSAVNDIYNGQTINGVPGLSPGDRFQLRRGGSVAQWRDRTFAALDNARQQQAAQATAAAGQGGAITAAAAGQGATAPSTTRPPLASFGKQAAPSPAPTSADGAAPAFNPFPVLNGG